MNTISVIIPCYKDSNTLKRAIDSVIKQTMYVHEIIVVNDCSPETSEIENVLRDYPQVIYIKNTSNIGLAASRNAGVVMSNCKIITFLDADDELHNQKIEFQFKYFTQINAVACETQIINKNDKLNYQPNLNPNIKVISNSRQNIWTNKIVGASIMISKDLITKIGMYDENLKSCEDFDLWLRILDAKINVTIVKSKLYKYYYNYNGLSKNYYNISFWEIQVLNKYFNFHKEISSFKKNLIYFFWILKQIKRVLIQNEEKMRTLIKSNIDNYITIKLLRFILKKIIYLRNV